MSLKPAKIENYSGYYFNWHGKISPLRKGYYLVIEDKSVGEMHQGLHQSKNRWGKVSTIHMDCLHR